MWIPIVTVLLLAIGSDSAITFLSEPVSNTSLYCAAVNKAIGPQAVPSTTAVVAELLLYNGADTCISDDVDVHKKVVLLTGNRACADEQIYENFYERGAVAIIRATANAPGSDINLGNPGARRYPNWNAIPFVEISEDNAAVIMSRSGTLVSVVPDPNLWQPVYDSLVYQVLLRWLPSAIALVTSITASVYLFRHVGIITLKYLNSTMDGDETCSGWLIFVLRNCNISVATLCIELISSFTLMVVWSVGGFWSTSNLPAPVVGFFATQLSGFAYITTVLSACFWYRMVAEVWPATKPGERRSPPSLLKRALRGELFFVNAIGIFGLLLVDTTLSVLYATNSHHKYPAFIFVNSLIFVTLDIVVGIYFLLGSIKLRMQMDSLLRKLPVASENLRRVRIRMMRCAFGLSVSMLAVSCVSALAGFAIAFYKTPHGWTIFWSIFTNFRILQSFFHVCMFRPATKPNSTTTQAMVNAPRVVTSDTTQWQTIKQ